MSDMLEFANGCFWSMVDGEMMTIGITPHGLSELGTIRELELPEVGEDYNEGDEMATVVGRDGELCIECPAALKIVELNHEVKTNPTFLEDDPTGDGWILRGELQ
jgi:glycine cleavage system H protein